MSSDTLLMNGGNGAPLLNGNMNDFVESSQEQVPMSSTSSNTIEQTYDSLFPALPEGNNFGRTTNFTQWSTPSSHSNPNGSDLTSNGHSSKIMKVRSSKVTEHFTIFGEEKRDTRRICADIAKETDTDIEMTNNSKGLTFLITGKQQKVKEAKKRISAELTTPTVYEFEAPKEAYGFILGKNGSRLKELEQRTGAKVTLPKSDSNELIKIKGVRNSGNAQSGYAAAVFARQPAIRAGGTGRW